MGFEVIDVDGVGMRRQKEANRHGETGREVDPKTDRNTANGYKKVFTDRERSKNTDVVWGER